MCVPIFWAYCISVVTYLKTKNKLYNQKALDWKNLKAQIKKTHKKLNFKQAKWYSVH